MLKQKTHVCHQLKKKKKKKKVPRMSPNLKTEKRQISIDKTKKKKKRHVCHHLKKTEKDPHIYQI